MIPTDNPIGSEDESPIVAELVSPDFSESARYHVAILTISFGVLIAASILQLSGGDGVRLPGGSTPLPETCFAQRMFGIECPGCGLTRSTICMMRGDIAAAARFNAMGPVLFVFIVAQLPYRGWALWQMKRRKVPALRGVNWIAVLVIVGLIGQWIVRLAM